jgi:hypothetical protein
LERLEEALAYSTLRGSWTMAGERPGP